MDLPVEQSVKATAAERMTWIGHEATMEACRRGVLTYLRDLGMRDPDLLESVARECLNEARKRVGPGQHDELLRRAIEEAQRRMDAALARRLGLSTARDGHLIAGARAALLMCSRGLSTDFLFEHPESHPDLLPRLKAALPAATPPESPRAMAPQKLEFLLFKST